MENKTDIIPVYKPTEKELEARGWAYDSFDHMWEVQNRSYRQFNNQTLQTYLDNGRKKLNIMSTPRRDGRSNVKSSTPLNKLMAILAKIALNRPKIKTTATNKANTIDTLRGQIVDDLYKHSQESIDREDSADTEYFFEAFDTIADGTKIVYEGWDNKSHKVKTITSYDPDTGEVTWEETEEESNEVFSVEIQPEDFFVWNPYMRSTQKQPRVGWRTILDRSTFDQEFEVYANHKYVVNGSTTSNVDSDSYFRESWFDRINSEKVEVLRIYDKTNQRLVIVANGVVLQNSPFPWIHGKYPFAKTINSPFAGGEFFWGMHLYHKIGGNVESIETLHNIGVEQAKLSVNPVTITTEANDLEDTLLLSGRIITVDDINNFKELSFKSPDQAYFNFIDMIGKDIDLASVDAVASGVNVKDVTARGQVIAEENARKLLGLLNTLMENLVLQRAKLRVPNIIQFQLIPGREFRIEDTTVGGENGVREVKVIGNIEDAESPKMIDMIESMAEQQGVNLERLNITPAYLQGIEYGIKVISESAFKQARSLEIAQQRELVGDVSSLFPRLFQATEDLWFKEIVSAHNVDPQKFLDAAKQNTNANAQQMLQQAQGGQQVSGGVSGEIGQPPSLGKLSETDF